MSDKQFIIRRTIVEEFEFDPYEVNKKLGLGSKLADNPQAVFINVFEEHDGSTFGDSLFGQINFDDGGTEIIVRDNSGEKEEEYEATAPMLNEAAFTFPPCSKCGKPWQEHYAPEALPFKMGPNGNFGLAADHTPHIPGYHVEIGPDGR